MSDVRYDFAGRTVMVTGGGSGIGAALAAAFLDAGANVAVADINVDSAARVVSQCDARDRAQAFAVDVSDEASVRSAIDGIVERFGRLDIALNNAGIEADTVPLAELDSANFRRVTEVNMASVFYCMKAEIQHMLTRGGGVILNTASISGLIGGYRLSAYTATKHAVIGMTKCAAMEYGAKGIRINALCPGLTDTPFIGNLPEAVRDRMIFGIPVGRPADPPELAAAALWLCSSGASYVTGHAMIVDGGVTAGETSTRFDDLMD